MQFLVLRFDPTKNMYHAITENLNYISTELQDTLPVNLKKCFQFKDKNKLAKLLMENKAVFHALLNIISQNWHRKQNYLKKNMKLNKFGLKQ